MNFAAGLPWLPVPVGGLPVPTKVEGISAPVQIVKPVEVDEVVPGVIPQGGSVSDGLASLAKGFEKGLEKMIDPVTMAAVAKGFDTLGGALQGQPSSASSGADGRSGNINQTVNFGDIVAKGFKFDLGSLPTWAWVALGGMGLIAFLKFNKKGKK